ncbi:MAG: hypothetical protein K6B68_02265 [Eubacterium sp.]|nr:hypothetical protein [Eubacterium sp.]
MQDVDKTKTETSVNDNSANEKQKRDIPGKVSCWFAELRKKLKHNIGTPQNFLILFAAFLIVVMAFLLPYVAFAYENKRLTDYNIHYESEPVDIRNSSMPFAYKLKYIEMVMTSYSYIIMDENALVNTNDKLTLNNVSAKEKAVEGFLQIFASMDYLEESQVEMISDSLTNLSDYSSFPELMVIPSTKEMFAAWNIEFIVGDGNYVQIIVDDETGLILAFEISETIFGLNTLELIQSGEFGNVLANYYGFEYNNSVDFVDNGNKSYDFKLLANEMAESNTKGNNKNNFVTVQVVILDENVYYGSDNMIYMNCFDSSNISIFPDEDSED